MKKYKVFEEIGDGKNHIIERNIEECELESYIRKYIQLEYFEKWYKHKYDVDLEYGSLSVADLEDNINNYVHELCENMVENDIVLYLGNGLFMKSYEQNVRLFISLFDYGELVPVCARPDGEHKLIILDNGVVHNDITDKPVGTIDYNVGVEDFDFSNFKFCCEVVIDTANYLNYLSNDISLADMILKHFNGKTPFDIEFAEKEKQ